MLYKIGGGMMKKERDEYWDLVKGIGIISIVIGHSCSFAAPFVYTYHLVIFFFVGGYFYNNTKYSIHPFRFTLKTIKASYVRYVFYSIIIILLHNLSVKNNMLLREEYAMKDFLSAFKKTLIFKCPELFAGALWFVIVYIVSLVIFAYIVFFSEMIANIISEKKSIQFKNRIVDILVSLGCIIIGAIGCYRNIHGLELIYNLHTSLLVVPIILLAYLVKKYKFPLREMSKAYLSPILAAAIFVLVYVIGLRIELAQEKIINSWMFYLVSILGIVFCLCLANLLCNFRVLKKIVSFWGKYSFSIMALHFFVFKVIDCIYSSIIGETNVERISQWGVSYSEQLWPIYVIFGTFLPALFSCVINAVAKKLSAKILCCKVNEK